MFETLDYGLFCVLDLETGLTSDVTGRQGMLTLRRYLIPPLVCLGVRACPFSDLYFLQNLLTTLTYICHFILQNKKFINKIENLPI
jgi:hypothetical protein